MFEFPARDRRNRFLNSCHENGKSEYEMEHLISCADHFSKWDAHCDSRGSFTWRRLNDLSRIQCCVHLRFQNNFFIIRIMLMVFSLKVSNERHTILDELIGLRQSWISSRCEYQGYKMGLLDNRDTNQLRYTSQNIERYSRSLRIIRFYRN